jgi:hypothetical protein
LLPPLLLLLPAAAAAAAVCCSNNPELSTLTALLKLTGLKTKFEGCFCGTLLAPTNEVGTCCGTAAAAFHIWLFQLRYSGVIC